jgi:hypothetical protein
VWYHVVATYDGSQVLLYMNDVLQGSAAFTGAISYTNTADLYLGSRNGASLYLSGTLDEVKIYTTAVTPEGMADEAARTVPLAITSNRPTALAVPNPIRDEGAFVVRGTDVARVRVTIYDLSGRLVRDSGWRAGDRVEWQGEDGDGRMLSNGVYIFVVVAELPEGSMLAFPPGKVFLSH